MILKWIQKKLRKRLIGKKHEIVKLQWQKVQLEDKLRAVKSSR